MDSSNRGQIGIWVSYIVVCGIAILTICIAISLRSLIARLEIRAGMIIVEELQSRPPVFNYLVVILITFKIINMSHTVD